MIQTALKEWAIAIEALAEGETIVLLRKGGIREAKFAITRPDIWLYPTYEHQKPSLLKPEYADRVVPVPSGWHPEMVPIQAWATITHEFEITSQTQLDALLPYHIWNEQFAEARLKWKPRLPLTVLLLRVFRLGRSVEIAFDESYGGCRSWIDWHQQIDESDSLAVLKDDEYADRVQKILEYGKYEPPVPIPRYNR